MRVARKLANRLRMKPEQFRVLVYRYDLENLGITPERRAQLTRAAGTMGLVMREITDRTNGVIDEITAIDPWKAGRATTLHNLANGWRCYVARHRDQLVAQAWVIVGKPFRETYLMRELQLAPHEAYLYRASTVPAYRGRAVMPLLLLHLMEDVATTTGVTQGYGGTRIGNRAMSGTLTAIGWRRVGHLGFVGALGARLHYLWGPNAFSHTRRRLYLDLRRGVV
jgi:hypothetical protein